MHYSKEVLELPEDEQRISLMDIPQKDFLIMYGDKEGDVTGECVDCCHSCKHAEYCEIFMVDYGYNDKGEHIVVNCDNYENRFQKKAGDKKN